MTNVNPKIFLYVASSLGLLYVCLSFSSKLFAWRYGIDTESVRFYDIIFFWVDYYQFNDMRARLLIFTALPIFLFAGLVYWLVTSTKKKDVHGDASFMTKREAKKEGLFASEGIILGRMGKELLVEERPGMISVIAPERGFKGSSFLIPNVMNFHGSMVITDPDDETYEATSGYLAERGIRVIRIAPLDEERRTHRYDPLRLVRQEPDWIADSVQKVFFSLIKRHTAEEHPMWADGGRTLCEGLYFYRRYKELPLTVGGILHEVRDRDLESFKEQLRTYVAEEGTDLPVEARQAFMTFVGKPEKEAGGVLTTIQTSLSVWRNPLVDACTNGLDFDPAEFRRRPTAVFVCIPALDLFRLAPLVNILVQQVLETLMRRKPKGRDRYPVFMPIDEIAAFDEIPALKSGLGRISKYGISLAAIMQHQSQLPYTYNEHFFKTLMGNVRHSIYHSIPDNETAGYVSRRLGTKTIWKNSYTQHGIFKGLDNISRTKQAYKIPLMSETQLMQMSELKGILLPRNKKPVKIDLIRHWHDKPFVDLKRPPVKVPKLDLINRHEE